MPPTASKIDINEIHHLLAENGYEVTDSGENTLTIREIESGVSLTGVLQDTILFLSLNCLSVPESELTPQVLRTLLDGQNGISTSHFQLYPAAAGQVAITLSNFCTLLDMGPEDQDDVLACVHYLLVDVLHARDLLGGLHS